ncbi:MAG: autotransporter-associated beta strand repeat-containing protein, partial [Myxococcota bacterium]
MGSVLELRVDADVDDHASVISGAGAFDKSGDGRLEFTNSQTYTGGTTVSGGVLSSQNLPLDRALAISAGATLEFDVPMGAMTPVSGAITGAGRIDKSGSGVLVFSGSNGFTGNTTLSSGEIQGPGTSIPGNVQMSGGTKIEFTDTGTSTYSGVLTSNATALLRMTGSGMLSLTGDNSGFVGTLDIQSGTVSGNVASLPDRITNAAALIFNQVSNASYAGVISGEGGVTKSGSGTLTITDDQSYTGVTTISAGRLNTNATLAGAVNVASGATLGGTGVVAGPITVSGTIAPGVEDSPEPTLDTILTAQASVSFEANSTFRPILFENGVANQLRALGEVTIDSSATLDPSFANITAGREFTVLRASAFTTLDPDEPFQVPEFAFVSITQMIEDVGGESMLNLIIESGGSALPLADTANQFQVARALDTTDANSTLADAISSLKGSSLTPDQARAVFDEISPEVVGGFASTRLSVARRVNDQVQARIRDMWWQAAAPYWDSGESSASSARGPAAVQAEGVSGFGSWLDGYGVWG